MHIKRVRSITLVCFNLLMCSLFDTIYIVQYRNVNLKSLHGSVLTSLMLIFHYKSIYEREHVSLYGMIPCFNTAITCHGMAKLAFFHA